MSCKEKAQVRAFSVSASVSQQLLKAIVLKFSFENSTDVLFCGWPYPTVVDKLKMALYEYYVYLTEKQVQINPDSLEKIMQMEAPKLTLDEVESIQVTDIVVDFDGHVTKENTLELTLKFYDRNTCIVLTPNYFEWVLGYIGNVLEHFDDKGNILKPTGMVN